MEKIHDVTKQTEERIATIQKYQKNLDDNLNERKKKKQNFVHLLEKLTNDINMIENVVKNQTKKSNDLDSSIIQKEADNEDFKERIKTNHEKQINEIKKYKENINLFNEIQQQIFSTNQEKDYIVDELCSYDCDIFLDVMFNVIFSKLYSVKYRKNILIIFMESVKNLMVI